MHEGEEWKNGIWTDLRSDSRIKFQFQGVVARPWTLERRTARARGIYIRFVEDDRFTGQRILSEVQWRLNSLVSAGGSSAF